MKVGERIYKKGLYIVTIINISTPLCVAKINFCPIYKSRKGDSICPFGSGVNILPGTNFQGWKKLFGQEIEI